MSTPLRVLLVEDSDDDAALVTRELRRGGFEPQIERVETQPAFARALRANAWDVIIADYALPTYTGLRALHDLRESGLDIPFILVSGTIGEAVAVEAMKAGAQDYVLKAQLTRLPPAIVRELREARSRVEQRRMREQLFVSERMASAGSMAAGVAHEINNPLAVVLANIDFVASALADLRPDPSGAPETRLERCLAEVGEPLRDAQEGARRIREIVRDVTLFSRPNDSEHGPVDVERVIDSSLRMAWNEIRHKAKVARNFARVPRVDANEARLGQLLLNLIVNAAHAIPEGKADRNEIRVSTRVTDSRQVVVEVRDTGAGILPENLGRIFEPFFTTKPVGVGTGLGLAICHRIVHDLGGEIAVDSEPGKGTTFRVSLPPCAPDDEVEEAAQELSPWAGRARVLIVEDEIALCRAFQRVVAPHHHVVALTHGREALVRIAGGERFDVILADLLMPEVTGMEMYEALRQIAPAQAERMVFITGGAFTTHSREFLERISNQRVEKPIDLARLLAIISEVARQ